MRKKIWTLGCLVLSLFFSLSFCSGKIGTLITDDVSKLAALKQNIPSDYEIPVSFIPKEVAGPCWLVLNIYPLEQSLRKLSSMFGSVSSNRENVLVFIAMMKNLRFAFDHDQLETAMQVFQCHYRDGSLVSPRYFDYVNELLFTAASQETFRVSCRPPPKCPDPQHTPGGLEESRNSSWLKRIPLILALIPFTVCVVIVTWLVKSGRVFPACTAANSQMAGCESVSSVSISVPMQTIAHSDSHSR